MRVVGTVIAALVVTVVLFRLFGVTGCYDGPKGGDCVTTRTSAVGVPLPERGGDILWLPAALLAGAVAWRAIDPRSRY
ncbi:MAG: hypothetical protein M3Q27_13230 [Actinomycetota bacterium]|nr:hypothetical protein [Actinomycetota bacterium]